MKSITKTSTDGIKVTVSSGSPCYTISICKDGIELRSGYCLITSHPDMPAEAAGLLRSNERYTPLSKNTMAAAEEAVAEYMDQPAIRLPIERKNIVMELSCLHDEEAYLREQDYNNDTGFHNSAPVQKEIEQALLKLAEFDIANPSIIAQIKKDQKIKDRRDIQSALNA